MILSCIGVGKSLSLLNAHNVVTYALENIMNELQCDSSICKEYQDFYQNNEGNLSWGNAPISASWRDWLMAKLFLLL